MMAEGANLQAEVIESNEVLIVDNVGAGGLATIASYLLQDKLISRQNRNDALAIDGRRTKAKVTGDLIEPILLKITSDPQLWFPKFIQALRKSDLGHVADKLELDLRKKRQEPEHEADQLAERLKKTTTPREIQADSSQQEDGLDNVFKKIAEEIPHMWQSVAEKLGIPYDIVGICRSKSTDDEECFRFVLDCWKKNSASLSLPYNRESMVKVLTSINRPDLVKRLSGHSDGSDDNGGPSYIG